MKSASEWLSENEIGLFEGDDAGMYGLKDDAMLEFIRAIQADALKAAAEKCEQLAEYRLDQSKRADDKPLSDATLRGMYGAMFAENLVAKKEILSLLPES